MFGELDKFFEEHEEFTSAMLSKEVGIDIEESRNFLRFLKKSGKIDFVRIDGTKKIYRKRNQEVIDPTEEKSKYEVPGYVMEIVGEQAVEKEEKKRIEPKIELLSKVDVKDEQKMSSQNKLEREFGDNFLKIENERYFLRAIKNISLPLWMITSFIFLGILMYMMSIFGIF